MQLPREDVQEVRLRELEGKGIESNKVDDVIGKGGLTVILIVDIPKRMMLLSHDTVTGRVPAVDVKVPVPDSTE